MHRGKTSPFVVSPRGCRNSYSSLNRAGTRKINRAWRTFSSRFLLLAIDVARTWPRSALNNSNNVSRGWCFREGSPPGRVCRSDLPNGRHVISQSETFLRLHARLRDPARVRVHYNGERCVTVGARTYARETRETKLVRQSKSELCAPWLTERLRNRLYPRASRGYSISETIKAAPKDANIWRGITCRCKKGERERERERECAFDKTRRGANAPRDHYADVYPRGASKRN